MTPEKKIENQIRKNIQTLHGWETKIFAAPQTNKGIPDIIGVLNNKFIAIEVKRPTGGKPTPVQLKTLQKIANAGGIAVVSNDPNIATYIYNNQLAQESIKSITIDIDNITPNQATKLWNFSKEPHTLLIRKDASL